MDLTSAIQLSSFLQGRLHNYTFAEILSSLQALSGMPIHPYDQAKYKYFGKDFHFPTIHDIPAPVDFNYGTYTSQLSSILDKTHLMGVSALSAMEEQMKFATESNPGMLKKTDIENMVITDENVIRNNIKFTEVVKSISLSDIETKPVELAQKLLSHYITLFKETGFI